MYYKNDIPYKLKHLFCKIIRLQVKTYKLNQAFK